jgi:DNA-binding CsgD family transcriptional regulator
MPPKSGKNHIGITSRQARPGIAASTRSNAKVKPHNPGSAVKIETREREEQALALRKKGMNYPDIGRKLGVSTSTAFQMIMRVLAAYEDSIKEQVPRVRQLELERLDDMLTKLQPKIDSGDDRAVNTALNLMARRAKFMGLDAPTEVHSTGEIQLVPDADLDNEIRQLNASLGMIAEGMNPVRIVDVVPELEEATVEVDR